MNDNEYNFDETNFSSLVDSEKLAQLSAKVEIAKLMMDRAMELAKEAHTEIKFYSVIAESTAGEENRD
jgi:hypothetical protein